MRLPAAYRFDTAEVFIRKDPVTGDVILSRRPEDWDGFLAAAAGAHDLAQVPEDFMGPADRQTVGHVPTPDRDPLDEVYRPTEH